MAISINYQKRKNINLFNKFQTNKLINLSNAQNYIPIYDRFFSLNETNWNSINLNHTWSISDKGHREIQMLSYTTMGLPGMYSCHSEMGGNGYVYIYINFVKIRRS